MSKCDETVLEIHENKLEKDAATQPQLLFKWGKERALARKNAKVAKNNLKLVEADLGKQVRNSPSEFDVDKVTETSVKEAILTHKLYQKAHEDQIEAEYEADVLDEFVNALTDKSKEIGVMSQLHGQQYWSKPKLSEGDQQEQRENVMSETVVKKKKNKEIPY
jgi:hypothetical protein